MVSVLQVDRAVFFSATITVAAFVPLFTMQGVEGQIFGPMARTYGYALAGALIATFTVTPVLSSLLVPEHVKETETIWCGGCATRTRRRCVSRWRGKDSWSAPRRASCCWQACCDSARQ
jgi:Cu/Ag efflux pump CusA